MAADNGSYDLDALADEQVTELFGWPVRLLDEIRELHDRAYSEGIGIEEWRQRDASLRADGPKCTRPREEMKGAQDAAPDAWVSAPADEKETTGQRMLRLAERLGAALEGAPDDEGLREQLRRIDGMLTIERHQGVKARLREHRQLVAEWLAGSAHLDEQTSLPATTSTATAGSPTQCWAKFLPAWNSPGNERSPKPAGDSAPGQADPAGCQARCDGAQRVASAHPDPLSPQDHGGGEPGR